MGDLRPASVFALLALVAYSPLARAGECKPGHGENPDHGAKPDEDLPERRHRLAKELDLKVARLQEDTSSKAEAARVAQVRLEAAQELVTKDSTKTAELTAAAQVAEATQRAWAAAKAAFECTKLDRDAAWDRYFRSVAGGYYASVSASAAGAAGGANALGGNVLFSLTKDISPNYELGVAAATMQELGAAKDKRTLVFGPRWRVYFTWLHTGVFLGAAPDVYYRVESTGLNAGAQLSLAGQFGVRVRSSGTNIGILRLFIEPRAVLDGSTPFSVFFGAEIGFGTRLSNRSIGPEPDIGHYTSTR